ncbi:MAG: gamma-glutamyltransferase [Porticoccaceae bacterium]|nr:gamma-glutamyltransferase [Porticoccaceae bacterium]
MPAKKFFFSVLIVALFAIPPAFGDGAAILEYGDRFHPQIGQGGMVVSQEQLASRVGADILARGGNAVDAAVATGFALAVTLPQAGNLGGGGFMLIHLGEENKNIAIDYREMAPATAHADLFVNAAGKVDTQLSRFSALSSGVPGTVAGLVHAQKKYGVLPLSEVMAPAIALAKKGFPVSYPLAWSLEESQARLKKHSASTRYFYNSDGSVFKPGQIWRQPDLAATLKRIARSNGRDFYEGTTATMIVEEMAVGAGAITLEDLKNYQVIEREPVVGTYRDHQIISMPPPSSGGIHLLQMLNILEGWDLAALGHNSSDYIHRLVEAMRRAYADRSEYLGDPDFVAVPAQKLMDKVYGAELRAHISLSQATPSTEVLPGLGAHEESPQTTHYSVWDKDGNVVSNTYTLNFSYGNGIAVTGAGFLLNNEMDDFSAKAGVPNAYGLVGNAANAIAPGKRPLSSMTPVIVLKEGSPVLVTGSPGGSRIITSVLQMVLNVVDFDMNIAEATAAPRIHHQWLPDVLYVEKDIGVDTRKRLQNMGHKLETSAWSMGKTQSITRENHLFMGVSDYRWPGGSAESAD